MNTMNTMSTMDTMDAMDTYTFQPVVNKSVAAIFNNVRPVPRTPDTAIERTFVYNNIHCFKGTLKLSQIENIWDTHFSKKNRGVCVNCNMYPIIKPFNFKNRIDKSFPNGLIVPYNNSFSSSASIKSSASTTSSASTKPSDSTKPSATDIVHKYAFVCYICYNLHIKHIHHSEEYSVPMDTREGGDKVEDSYFDNFRKYH
jgi:hypothetical protein